MRAGWGNCGAAQDPFFYWLCWISRDDVPRADVFRHHGLGADDGAFADRYAGADEGGGANPGAVADDEGSGDKGHRGVFVVVGGGAEEGVLADGHVVADGDAGD